MHLDQTLKGFSAVNTDIQVFNALLEAWLPRQGLKKVLILLRAMQMTVGGPNHKTMRIIIRHMFRYRGVHPTHVIRFLCVATRLWPIAFDNGIYEMILSSAVRLQVSRWKGSHHVRSKQQLVELCDFLIRARVLPSPSHLHSVGALGIPHTGQQYLAFLLDSLHERRIRLSPAGLALQLRFQAVVRSDMRGAENTLAEMRNQGMKIGAAHYAALVEGYVRLDEFDAADSVAQRYAQQSGAVVLHTIIIHGYARSRQAHQAQAAFDNMLRRGIDPDWAAVDALVGAWSRSGFFEMAKRTLLRLWPLVTDIKPSMPRDSSLPALLREFRCLRRRDEPHLSQLILTRSRFGISARRKFNAMLLRLPTSHDTFERL